MKKSDILVWSVFISGYFAVIIQCLLVREFLSVFFGNELVLGILFSVWLLCTGVGSFWGTKRGRWHSMVIVSLLTGFAIHGVYLIRFFPRFFEPGSVIPTYAVALLFILAEAPVSCCTGYIFGILSRCSPQKQRVYGLENAGSLLGALAVFVLTMMHESHAVILLAAVVVLPVLLLFENRGTVPEKMTATVLFMVLLTGSSFIIIKAEIPTAAWKYAGKVSRIRQTKEGEIASMFHEMDTTILLNNTIYKSTLNKEVAEQAVHIPVAQLTTPGDVLVIFDRGHHAELAKYKNLRIDILETLPAVAAPGSIITAPEKYRTNKKYDLILCGSSLPGTTASSRFYTVSFFKRMHSLLAPDGVFSYTLPFNENYMPPNEKQLYTILHNTLASVFPHVLIFPGNGCATFMASGSKLHIPDSIAVPTDYLAAFTLPALSEDRIIKANIFSPATMLHRSTRPIALYFSLKNWMETYGFSAAVLWSIVIIIFIAALVILPRTSAVLSVSTSGFATGLYSISLMLLYQVTYGSLYAEIALLLIALALGFFIGSKVKRFPFSDVLIGIYCILSFFLLSVLTQPPVMLFFICHCGIGILSAAQFVTRRDESPGILNTADLMGGVFGMALSSTLLIPLFGIIPVMSGVFLLKAVTEIVVQRR